MVDSIIPTILELVERFPNIRPWKFCDTADHLLSGWDLKRPHDPSMMANFYDVDPVLDVIPALCAELSERRDKAKHGIYLSYNMVSGIFEALRDAGGSEEVTKALGKALSKWSIERYEDKERRRDPLMERIIVKVVKRYD